MKSLMLLNVISVLPRNWKSDWMVRYSKPPFKVWLPRVQVVALLIEIDRGSNTEPVVVDAEVARISRPLRAMPVLPRASIDAEVNVPDNETPTGSSWPGC